MAIGADNYRLSLCILFANKQLSHDYETLKTLALKHNITSEKHPKMQAMMLEKCNRTMPMNLTGDVGCKDDLYRSRRR